MKNFKTLLNIAFIATTLLFISCNNDDDEVITVQDLVVDINENPTNGQVIGTVQTNGSGDFTITSQTPTGALNIDVSTGEFTVADATLFDFETNPIITATVEVVGAVNTGAVTININNVNELSAQNLDVTIDENPTNGQSVGTVQAAGDGIISFSITSQSPSGALNIDTSTGELTVTDATLFDFETSPVITANISVNNSVNTTTAIATINLNNINELSIQDFDTAIDENPTNGLSIGTVQATGDGTLSFSITSQTPSGALSINASTGELTVADTTLFDFETNPVITASISVDNSVSTETATATINLNNINELGDFNHGGIIFWLDPADNSQGLVFAFNNQVSNLQWGCSGVTTGANGTTIGTGETNTTTITSLGCATGSAAEFVSSLNINGYNDWFLPSLDEFNEIGINYSSTLWPAIQANGGSALSGINWTSTESNNNQAYIYYLGSSTSSSYPKTGTLNALPIRSF